MVNIDRNNFNESLRQAKKVFDKDKKRLGDLISPFLSESLNKKEVVELCNLGSLSYR